MPAMTFRAALACILFLAIALCIPDRPVMAAVPASQERPAWMVGKWGGLSPSGQRDGAACPEPQFYGANGYVVYPGGGVDQWWIAGGILLRKTVVPELGGPPSERGLLVRIRIARLRNGDLILSGPGWRTTLFRCGSTPKDWAILYLTYPAHQIGIKSAQGV